MFSWTKSQNVSQYLQESGACFTLRGNICLKQNIIKDPEWNDSEESFVRRSFVTLSKCLCLFVYTTIHHTSRLSHLQHLTLCATSEQNKAECNQIRCHIYSKLYINWTVNCLLLAENEKNLELFSTVIVHHLPFD